MPELRYELLEEYKITPEVHQQIAHLLDVSFPDSNAFKSRSYFKQLPQRRLLVWDDTQLVAQTGLEHRVISADAQPLPIFGIIDLCVSPTHQNQGIASQMLQQIEQRATTHNIEFIILFATDYRLYLKNGYQHIPSQFRWFRIDEHTSHGQADEHVNELMVKPLTSKHWPKTTIDLLGYLF